MVHSSTIAALLVTVVLLLGLAAVAWRFRAHSGAELFGVLQALSAVWATLAIVGLRLPPTSLQLRVWGLNTGMSLLVAVFWFGFILSYTGRESLLTPARFGVVSLPLAVGAGLYFAVPTWQPLVGSVERAILPVGTVVQSSIGPVGAALGAYIYLVFLVGLGVVIKTILESNSIFLGQGLALVFGSLITILASLLAVLGVPTPGYPTPEVALGAQSVLWGYAVFGQRFLEVVPAVAAVGKRTVFDDLDDGILVVDAGGRITRANPAARAYLRSDAVGGEAVDSILDQMGVSALDDLPTRFQSRGQIYRATTSPITNWRRDTIGRTVVIQDVTPLVERQQRLQVLNRILRHNVRNSMNVVRGLATQLQGRDANGLNAIGDTISGRADELITISEKAVELDAILDGTVPAEPVDVEALVEEVVAPLADRSPDATIRTAVSAGEVSTNSRLLSLVLDELVANAVEHTGDAPEVTVDVELRQDRLEIVVADDGPGIPEMEIDSITAGEETSLRHASSLGLWLVSWGVQSLGGDVTFDASEAGTTVSVSLPDLDADRTAGTTPPQHERSSRPRSQI